VRRDCSRLQCKEPGLFQSDDVDESAPIEEGPTTSLKWSLAAMATAVQNSAIHEAQRKGPSENIVRRVQRTLAQFNLLPDDALIGIRTVSILIDRSPASIWRDVAKGRLPKPVKMGHSTRFHVGAVRAAMKGKA